MDDPARHRRNGEVADDADYHEHDIHPVAGIQREVGVGLHALDVALEHQHLNLGEYGAEYVRHGQPQIDLNVAAYPLRERALEAVPHRYGEGYRTEYRQHHEEEGADGVYHEGGGLEHQFQYLAEEVADALLHLVHPPVDIHPRHRHHVGGRPAQFLQLLVKLLVGHEVGGFGVAHHRLVFQPVLLLPVLVHVQSLRFEQFRRTLHDGREDAVYRAKHHRREEHDAQTDGKGTEHREDVYRFGSRQRLPYPVGDIEERAQPGDAFRHARHVGAQRHHLLVERAENLVKVVELHRLPVSFVHAPVQPHDAVKVVFLLRTQVAHADILVGVVAHEVAVTLHLGVAAFHHVHALLVRHGERGDVHHVLQLRKHVIGFLQQLRVPEGDGSEFLHREVVVAQHLLEAGHVDVRDVAYHQYGLLHLAGVLDQIVHGFEGVVILLALLVDFHRFLKVIHHVRGGLRGVDDVLRGIDDALRQIARIAHDPLGGSPAREKQAQADDECYSCSHVSLDFSGSYFPAGVSGCGFTRT